ncbi:MAG TPA: DUF1257 domain-containing protein [Haliangiales bacterium]|nr:DUF1257 domain-containing protein [Haliangiales bacterium]
MSHFTKCDLKITNLAALKRALDDLGLSYRTAETEAGVEVRGYKGAKMSAEISVDMGKYDIGVVKNADGTYEMVADWWGIEVTKAVTETEFVEELNQRYAYQRVVMACEEQGYTLEETKNEEDGTIQLQMKKWE